jgi:hypothetical protein
MVCKIKDISPAKNVDDAYYSRRKYFPQIIILHFISFVLYNDNMIPTLQLSVWCGISTFLALHFWSCIRKVEILIRKVEINTYPFCTWKIEIVLVFRFFCFFVVINLYYEISIISMSKTALNSLRQVKYFNYVGGCRGRDRMEIAFNYLCN